MPFISRWPQTYKKQHSKDKNETHKQKISTKEGSQEGLNTFDDINLTFNSDVDQDTYTRQIKEMHRYDFPH